MGLSQTQALLARLFTDATARRAFFANPEATAMGLGLDAAEARTLARLDRREVESFARSLLGKRALDARKATPLTARALGDAFDPLLFEAIEGAPAPDRHRADAAALAALLASRAGEPPWIGDLARYEMAFVAAARPGAVFLLRRFAWPVDDLSRKLMAGEPIGETAPRGRVGVWWRAPRGRLFWRLF
ncbi:MAG: hypothetical protein ACR652_21700 [Methylocystis sp.]|uniref:hypothetical protein n=1 Tax=Methylocystis sp. TaxID=1911079 RepID=UPI003DA5CF29